MTKRVEAAAKAIHDEFCREDWHSGQEIGQACYDMKHEAANVLAAADAVMFSDEAASWITTVILRHVELEPHEAEPITRDIFAALKEDEGSGMSKREQARGLNTFRGAGDYLPGWDDRKTLAETWQGHAPLPAEGLSEKVYDALIAVAQWGYEQRVAEEPEEWVEGGRDE